MSSQNKTSLIGMFSSNRDLNVETVESAYPSITSSDSYACPDCSSNCAGCSGCGGSCSGTCSGSCSGNYGKLCVD